MGLLLLLFVNYTVYTVNSVSISLMSNAGFPAVSAEPPAMNAGLLAANAELHAMSAGQLTTSAELHGMNAGLPAPSAEPRINKKMLESHTTKIKKD